MRLLASAVRAQLRGPRTAAIEEAPGGSADMEQASEAAWQALPALAELHRLSAVVARALAAHPPSRQVPASVASRLREDSRTTAVRALASLRPLAEVMDALAAQRIPALLWKGPALAVEAWGDVGTRASVDLDIVVRPRDRLRARAAVGALGWREPHGMSAAQERAIFSGRGAWELEHPAHDVKLELHWRFSALRYAGQLPVEEALERAVEREVGGVRVRIPGPADTLVLLAQHGAKHGWSSLEDVAPFAAILVRHPQQAAEAHARAAGLGLVRAMALAGAFTERAFGLELPAALASDAADPALAPFIAEVEARWARGDVAWRPSLRWDLAWTPRARDRIRMLWRSLFDPTLQEWLAARLPGPLVWLYPVMRPTRLLLRALVPSSARPSRPE